jgi:hypothetical protein
LRLIATREFRESSQVIARKTLTTTDLPEIERLKTEFKIKLKTGMKQNY